MSADYVGRLIHGISCVLWVYKINQQIEHSIMWLDQLNITHTCEAFRGVAGFLAMSAFGVKGKISFSPVMILNRGELKLGKDILK